MGDQHHREGVVSLYVAFSSNLQLDWVSTFPGDDGVGAERVALQVGVDGNLDVEVQRLRGQRRARTVLVVWVTSPRRAITTKKKKKKKKAASGTRRPINKKDIWGSWVTMITRRPILNMKGKWGSRVGSR